MTRPPSTPSGTTVSTMSVDLKLPNSSTRIAKMPKMRDDDRGADAAERFLARLRFAAERVAIAARPAHRVEPLRRPPPVTFAVLKPRCDVGVDGDGALAVVALDLRRALARTRASRAARCGSVAPESEGTRTSPSASRSARAPTGVRTTMSYCSPLGSLNVPAGTPATERRTARSNSTVGTPSRLAFCGSTSKLQVGARHLQRILHVARARDVASSSCSTCAASCSIDVEIAADDAHRDRRA